MAALRAALRALRVLHMDPLQRQTSEQKRGGIRDLLSRLPLATGLPCLTQQTNTPGSPLYKILYILKIFYKT